MEGLSEEGLAIVDIVREFVDREVKPVVQELEHANTYPEAPIESMKAMGIYGLAIDEPWGATRSWPPGPAQRLSSPKGIPMPARI